MAALAQLKEWDPVQFGSVTFNPDMWTSTGGSHGQKNAVARKNSSEKITDLSSKFDDKFDYPPEDLTTISKQSEEEIDEEEMEEEDLLVQESIQI